MVVSVLIIGCVHYIPLGIFSGYSYDNRSSQKDYSIQKEKLSPLEMVAYYTDLSFSQDVRLLSYKFISYNMVEEESDKKSESLMASIAVPEQEIDAVFPPVYRNYDIEDIPYNLGNEKKTDLSFYRYANQAVAQKGIQTDRAIHYAVQKPKDGYCIVNAVIDKLGWHVANQKRLGGFGEKVITIHTKDEIKLLFSEKAHAYVITKKE